MRKTEEERERNMQKEKEKRFSIKYHMSILIFLPPDA